MPCIPSTKIKVKLMGVFQEIDNRYEDGWMDG